MNRLSWRPITAAVVALTVSLACGGDEPMTGMAGPVPGALVVSLTTRNTDDGAILFSIGGGGISNPSVESSSHVLFFRATSTSSINAVVVGNITAGPLLRFNVPDVGEVSSYFGTITEVADRANALRTPLSGYSLEITSASSP